MTDIPPVPGAEQATAALERSTTRAIHSTVVIATALLLIGVASLGLAIKQLGRVGDVAEDNQTILEALSRAEDRHDAELEEHRDRNEIVHREIIRYVECVALTQDQTKAALDACARGINFQEPSPKPSPIGKRPSRRAAPKPKPTVKPSPSGSPTHNPQPSPSVTPSPTCLLLCPTVPG